jgi:hypothetical protein
MKRVFLAIPGKAFCTALFLFGITAAVGVTYAKQEADNKRRCPLVLAVNGPGGSFEPGEAVPFVMAFANVGKQKLYFSRTPPTISVRDSRGKPIRRDLEPFPSIPSGDSFMEKDGKRIYVKPAYAIAASEGFVEVVSNALKGQYVLKKGIYTVQASFSVSFYPPDSVFVRPDLKRKQWVDPDSAVSRTVVRSNKAEIQIE